MASFIGFNKSASLRESTDLSGANAQYQPVPATAPWKGYLPDLDVGHLGPSACRDIEGLAPRADENGHGEVLGKFAGFRHVDDTYDGSSATSPLALGDNTGTSQHVTGLQLFARVNATGQNSGEFEDTTIAVTAGDGSTAASGQVWRVVPSTGVWEEIVEGTGGSSVAMIGSYPGQVAGSAAQLCDFAVLPVSAEPRTGLTAVTAGEPTLVWTNNVDNVKMYAVEDGGSAEDGFYEDLTEAFGTGASGFKARSVEAWGDRLNFLNTEEGGTRHRQRLRRTAIGNADPDTANDGSGALDFRDFQGEGLRVESLGNVLACYFEDGVAFVRRTYQSQSPYTTQIITTKRGLLSTHSLVNLGGGQHFGLFTDGWFFLNENGQFQEAGLVPVEDTPTHKWRTTFFERLDTDQRDRIHMTYDAKNHWVQMTLPMDGSAENEEVWIYDIHADRLFTRTIPVTVFGTTNLQLSDGLTVGPGGSLGSIGGLGDLSIGELTGTLGSFAPRFGLSTLIHGTHSGLVVSHDPGLTTIISAGTGTESIESWKYETILSGMGVPHFHKSVREITAEFVRTTPGSFTITLRANPGDSTVVRTYTIDLGSAGDVQSLTRGFRYSNPFISMEVSGSTPVNFRSFIIDIRNTLGRVRRVS